MQLKSIPHHQFALGFGAMLSLFVLAGCGGGAEKGPDTYPVKGEVTFDGKPVDTGQITFRKAEGDHRPFSGQIKDGKYELQAEAGKMTVEITASRPSGKMGEPASPDEKPEPIGEMYIPDKYNTKTELTADVAEKTDGNDIPFTLTGK